MIIGLLGLLIVTRTEEGDLLFYKGQVKESQEEGFNFVRFSVALLWIIPFTCMFVGVG